MHQQQATSDKRQFKVVRFDIKGLVQGVGFRPFLHRLAIRHKLIGEAYNTTSGVTVIVQGTPEQLKHFKKKILLEAPPLARVESVRAARAKFRNYLGFTIRSSKKKSEEFSFISPDIASCPECLAELRDKNDRRYHYPFINCTNCGPRFTIIKDIPYDRPKTTMASFRICPDCRREYTDIKDRRYHAQPNACHLCGPQVTLNFVGAGFNMSAIVLTKAETARTGDQAIKKAALLLKKGKVIAVKGLGGYHLACDAGSDLAVKKLKKRKGREDKPLALMVRSLADAQALVRVGKAERELLLSPRRPIVLLRKRTRDTGHGTRDERPYVSTHIAPGNNYLGIMLPYTPLHELLLTYARDAGVPALVMTSGNSSDEPLTKDDNEAVERLGTIADVFLTHDRPIHSRCDDSVVKIINGSETFIRRARGYVPAPVHISVGAQHAAPVLATGAELKNTFCLLRDDYAFLGPHIGDLKNAETMEYYRESIELFQRIFRVKPRLIACDLHPDYLSTRFAEDVGADLRVRPIRVQHHHAHIASCLAENRVDGPAIGVALDGTGYGTDGNIWGGEVLLTEGAEFKRLAHFAYVPMPGGDAAALESGRMTVSYLYYAFAEEMYDLPLDFWRWFPKRKARQLVAMIKGRLNSPLTSSCGRLFDAVAALFDLCRVSTYDGQAAVAVEMAAERCRGAACYARAYAFNVSGNEPVIIDFRPAIRGMVTELIAGKRPREEMLASFHRTVIKAVAEVVKRAVKEYKVKRIAFSGGAFQNKLLAEGLARALAKSGTVYQHKLVPPNDGGIALGQAVVARKLAG